ncbi:hypothetical protein ACLJJ6_00955 [Pediococcus siamensis]|uniref:hypothetical protein n=1 Tax=Pediococcus siamensis TaxID=381829 RepID=UPI0039A024FA
MTGSIRATAENLYVGYFHHDVTAQQKAADTGIVIGSFAAGAFLSGIFVPWLKDAAILVPAVLVLGAIFYLAQNGKQVQKTPDQETAATDTKTATTSRSKRHPEMATSKETSGRAESEPETRSQRRRHKF